MTFRPPVRFDTIQQGPLSWTPTGPMRSCSGRRAAGRRPGTRTPPIVGHERFEAGQWYGVRLSGATLRELFTSAAEAFSDALTPLAGIEPRQAEELDLDAPDLDELLVDFLCELLYRYDARGWLTRAIDLELHEKDGGWTLEGTLRGERRDAGRHPLGPPIAGVSYRGLHVREQGGQWVAEVLLER